MSVNNILVINSGSSSVKFKLFSNLNPVAEGIVERIGNHPRIRYKISNGPRRLEKNTKIKNHKDAIKKILKILEENGLGKNYIDAVGHRVVHGGKLSKSCIVTRKIEKIIEKNSELAPLHNPANLAGIRAVKSIMNVPNVAVFDTAFHTTMPEKSKLYALPYKWFTKYNIMRYGFHGTSHKYVFNQAKKLLRRHNKVITCHLGNGSSITAILNGKSIDTSMGFTPLEGIMMGTRSGSFDPSVVEFLTRKGLSIKEIMEFANKKSGLLGVSGISNDMRDILKSKSKRAELAVEMFSYIAAKTIASYAASLNGVDAIVFTAGIGENSPEIRKKICGYLEFLGVKIDDGKNSKNETIISSNDSKVKILVIPTNEELQIAIETKNVIEKHK